MRMLCFSHVLGSNNNMTTILCYVSESVSYFYEGVASASTGIVQVVSPISFTNLPVPFSVLGRTTG